MLAEAQICPPAFDRAYIERLAERCVKVEEGPALLAELSIRVETLAPLVGEASVDVARLFEIDALREIVGIVDVVHAAAREDSLPEPRVTSLSDIERAFLKLVRYAAADGGPWWFRLPRSQAESLRARHHEAHPRTPTLEELAEEGVFALTDEHIEFGSGRPSDWVDGAAVAAEVWRRHPAGTSQSVAEWLRRVDWLWPWPQALQVLSADEARPIVEHLIEVLCDSANLRVEGIQEAERLPREGPPQLSRPDGSSWPQVGVDRSSAACLVWWWHRRDLWSDLRGRPIRFAEAIFRYVWPQTHDERVPLNRLVELAEVEPTFLTAVVGIGAANARSNELVSWAKSRDRSLFAWVALNQVMPTNLPFAWAEGPQASLSNELRALTEPLMSEALTSTTRAGQAETVAQIAYEWAFVRRRMVRGQWQGDEVLVKLKATLGVVKQAVQVRRWSAAAGDAVFDRFLQAVESAAAVKHGLPVWAFSGTLQTLTWHSNSSDAAARLAAAYQRCLAAAPTLPNVWWVGNEQVPHGPWREWANALQQSNAMTQLLSLDNFDADVRGLGQPPDAEQERQKWRDAVRGNKTRLRTHLRVLLAIEASLIEGDTALVPIREALLAQLALHTVEDFQAGRLDILQAEAEQSAEKYADGRLLPVIAKFLMRLKPDARRDALATMVGSTTDVLRLLALDVALQTDATTAVISCRLNELDLEATLAETFWLGDLKNALAHAVEAGRDDDAKAILTFGDAAMAGHTLWADWATVAFNARIVLAYRAGDQVALEALTPPKFKARKQQGAESEAEMESRRQMFLALLRLPESPIDEVASLDRLLLAKAYTPSLTVNRFAAQVFAAEAATSDVDRWALATDALKVWQAHEATLDPRSRQAFNETCATNTVRAMAVLGRADDIEAYWAALPKEVQRRAAVAEHVARALLHLERLDEARKVIEAARIQLVPSDQALPEPLEAILDQLNRQPIYKPVFVEDTAPKLSLGTVREALDQLRTSAAHEVAYVLRHRHMSDLLLAEMQAVVGHALERTHHFKADLNEDGLNDWICSLLRSRLHLLGWQFTDQSRGGTSNSGKSPGERDMVVRTTDGVSIAVVEFLKLDSVATGNLKRHIDKLLTRYDPAQSSAAMVVVYYTGANLVGFWGGYRGYVDHTHDFGERRRLRGLQEVPSGCAAIRLGKTSHWSGEPSQPLRLGHLIVKLPPA